MNAQKIFTLNGIQIRPLIMTNPFGHLIATSLGPLLVRSKADEKNVVLFAPPI